MLRYRNNYNFLFQSHGSQHLINNNTRYKLELKHEIDLLHSFLFPISFLNFPRPSLFPVPLSSLSASLSLSLSLSLLACHGITSYRSPAACHLHQTAGASSSGRQPLRAYVSVSTLARVHSHACIYAHTDTARLASGRHTDGYGCHGSSAVLHSPSSPFSPYSRLRHALCLIHSFSPSLSRQPAISFQGCRW